MGESNVKKLIKYSGTEIYRLPYPSGFFLRNDLAREAKTV